MISDKSLSDVSETEKAEWRNYSDPKEFYESTGWDQGYLRSFVSDFTDNVAQIGCSFEGWLVFTAQFEMSYLYSTLEIKGLNGQIDWTKISYDDVISATTEIGVDNLIYVWTQLKKFSYRLNAKKVENEYVQMLATMMPKTRREDREICEKERAQAFHRVQRPTENGKLPSEAVYRKVVTYYNSYRDNTHLSPYTSIVGPSGIGKSFSIQQLAMVHGMYVVYTSFAGQNSTAYPCRSVISDKLPRISERRYIIDFWDSFATIILIHVEIKRLVLHRLDFSTSRQSRYTETTNINFHSKSKILHIRDRAARLTDKRYIFVKTLKSPETFCWNGIQNWLIITTILEAFSKLVPRRVFPKPWLSLTRPASLPWMKTQSCLLR